MQIHTKHTQRDGAPDKELVVLTPDDAEPERENAPLAVLYVPGSKTVKLRTNCPSDSSSNLIGVEAIAHIHSALGEILRRISAEPSVPRP